jgi:uncharacterized membrane protein
MDSARARSYGARSMNPDQTPDNGIETVYFEAELRPHRSLGPNGFLVVMMGAAGFGFAIGVSFMAIGAWPVFGFCGLEVALLYGAFRLNYRDARRRERIRLTDRGLRIRTLSPNGDVRVWDAEPSWLRVEVENHRRKGACITLSSHGRGTAIGKFLTPAERIEVACALRAAIARYCAAPNSQMLRDLV